MKFHCAYRARKSSANRARKVLRETTYTICTPFFIRVNAQSHYDAGGASVRDPGSTGMNRDSTGMNRGSIWDDSDEPRKPDLHRESIKKCNTSGMNRESPRRTGNDRRGTENNRDGTGNNRDGTLAPPGPIQTPAELRQHPGECR
ncbi:hypothetical protein DPMN_146875 [Dreissena polymorpha]|uniref:Uncharacterized protein n=1 Tax=Dreissena polymorpha TaxID=45954 RepID=A0A9D4FCL4_DREPO|nr:hypothetical protein DPMN_146875 [Dreissena polymorpha]